MRRDGIFNKVGEVRRNEDANTEGTYGLFFMRGSGIFNKEGEARRNEDNDAEGTCGLFLMRRDRIFNKVGEAWGSTKEVRHDIMRVLVSYRLTG